jgi:hypothetical protein
MSGEVELWNNDLPILEGGELKRRKGVVVVETCLEIFVPLACNVV